ncbi:hypothetical protein DVS77_05915 [Mycolicibacterium moriokaense]|nr:hypothetical protein DVS77_05915 [Mycolicibacterium moriokaense]
MTEATSAYCKVCGHPKEDHDLDVHLGEEHTKAREDAARGQGACHDMSYADHPCICVEYQSWT